VQTNGLNAWSKKKTKKHLHSHLQRNGLNESVVEEKHKQKKTLHSHLQGNCLRENVVEGKKQNKTNKTPS
jgi:hypothetical protein